MPTQHNEHSSRKFKNNRNTRLIRKYQTDDQPLNFADLNCPFSKNRVSLLMNKAVGQEKVEEGNQSSFNFSFLSPEKNLLFVSNDTVAIKNSSSCSSPSFLSSKEERCSCQFDNLKTIQLTSCSELANFRNRKYSQKIYFEANSFADKLKTELKKIAGEGFLQTACGEKSLDLCFSRNVYLPMDRKHLGKVRTVRQEVLDAIDGTVHQYLQVIIIKDLNHHVKGLPGLEEKHVAGIMWIGPNIPASQQIVLGIYAGDIQRSSMVQFDRQEYAIDIIWDDKFKRFIRDAKKRKLVKYHRYYDDAQSMRLSKSQLMKDISKELGWMKCSFVLPYVGYYSIDSMTYFNEITLINDPRDLIKRKRLRTTALFYRVYYEGWPYYVVTNNPREPLLHGDEILLNCGAAYRISHLERCVNQLVYNALKAKRDRGISRDFCYCSSYGFYQHLDMHKVSETLNYLGDQARWESDSEFDSGDTSDGSSSNDIKSEAGECQSFDSRSMNKNTVNDICLYDSDNSKNYFINREVSLESTSKIKKNLVDQGKLKENTENEICKGLEKEAKIGESNTFENSFNEQSIQFLLQIFSHNELDKGGVLIQNEHENQEYLILSDNEESKTAKKIKIDKSNTKFSISALNN